MKVGGSKAVSLAAVADKGFDNPFIPHLTFTSLSPDAYVKFAIV